MKKFIIMTLVLAMFLSVSVSAGAYNTVTNTPREDMKLINNGPFITGNNGNVMPNGTISRAELAQIIYNMYGQRGYDFHIFEEAGGWYDYAVASIIPYGLFTTTTQWQPAVNGSRGIEYSYDDFFIYLYDTFDGASKPYGPFIRNDELLVANSVKSIDKVSKIWSYQQDMDSYTAAEMDYKWMSGAVSFIIINNLIDNGFLTEADYDAANPPAPFVAPGDTGPAFDWVPNIYFRPEEKVTREELALVMYRMLGKTETAVTGNDRFPDIAKLSTESRAAINALNDAGIIKGMPDGTYNPNGTCTRAEVVVMLVRTLSNQLTASTRTDIPADLVGHWSQSEFMKAVKSDPPGTVYTPEPPKHDHEFVPLSDTPWRGLCACGEEKTLYLPTDAELGL